METGRDANFRSMSLLETVRAEDRLCSGKPDGLPQTDAIYMTMDFQRENPSRRSIVPSGVFSYNISNDAGRVKRFFVRFFLPLGTPMH